jgi:hypothetical protein
MILATIVAVYLAMVFWAGVRDDYDADHRKTDPLYCRYSASFKEVLVWWWHRRRKPVLPQWPQNRWPGS